MATTAPTNIGENNNILVSSIEKKTAAVKESQVTLESNEEYLSDTKTPDLSDTKTPDLSDTKMSINPTSKTTKAFVNEIAEVRQNEVRKQQQKQQQKEQQKITSPKPSYESVSEDDKITFLQELSELFKAKLQAKKAMWENKFPLDEKGVINDYKILSQQLQKSIPLLRGNSMLRSSIVEDSKLFVVFTSTDEMEKQFDEINTKGKKKSFSEIRLQAELKNKLDQSNDQLVNFNYMIDILKKNKKLKDFNEFLTPKKNTKRPKKKVVYERLLFLIIMQGYNKEPVVDNTSINDLTEALNGNYHPTRLTAGGKRRTKKIKIKSKKTRSIKRSKKNITRRR